MGTPWESRTPHFAHALPAGAAAAGSCMVRAMSALPRRGRHPAALLLLIVASVLAGCASGPSRTGATPERDGPEANPPPNLVDVPDAEPRVEPIRAGGPNKPYGVLGQSYVPITQDLPFTERGLASWYGRKFQGRRTSSGELYNMYAMTAAHPTLPIPSYARIRNPANGREVVVRINDRGPFHSTRIVDLSYTAALKLDVLRGVAPVELQRITFEEIRTGAWRRGVSDDALRVAALPATASAVVPVGVTETAPTAGAAVASPVLQSLVASSPLELATTPGKTAPTPTASAAAAPSRPLPADANGALRPPTPDALTPLATLGAGGAAPSDAAPAPAATSAVAVRATPAANPLPQVADAPSARAFTAPARGFWVQLGAFRERDGAEGFHRRVSAEADWIAPLLAVFGEASMFRLQAGPYPSRDEARGVAHRLRATLQLVPLIVERR